MSTLPSPSATPPNDSTASPSREAPPNDSTAPPPGEPPDSTASPSGEAPPNDSTASPSGERPDSTASPSGEPPPNDSRASPSGEAPPIAVSSPWEAPVQHHLLSRMWSCLTWFFILACLVASIIAFGFFLDDIINKSPHFYLSDLRGPPLEANPGSAVTVCEFTIRNTAHVLSVRYKKFEITLRHPSGREVAGTIPAFTQGVRRKTKQEVSFQFENDTPVAAPRNLSGAAVFRVSLQTKYLYERSDGKYSGFSHRVRRVGDVEVNREGRMASPERILLVSAGARGVASTGWLAAVAVVGSFISIV